MKYKIFILILLGSLILHACGVKAPPQPPLTPAEAEFEEKQEKIKEEHRKKQLEALEAHKKKLQEQENNQTDSE